MQCTPNSRSDGHALPEQTLVDRSDGKEFVLPRIVCLRTTDSQPQPSMCSNISSYSITRMQCIPNWRSDGHTLAKRSLADRADGKESVEPKVVGVCIANHSLVSMVICLGTACITMLISRQNGRSDCRTNLSMHMQI